MIWFSSKVKIQVMQLEIKCNHDDTKITKSHKDKLLKGKIILKLSEFYSKSFYSNS